MSFKLLLKDAKLALDRNDWIQARAICSILFGYSPSTQQSSVFEKFVVSKDSQNTSYTDYESHECFGLLKPFFESTISHLKIDALKQINLAKTTSGAPSSKSKPSSSSKSSDRVEDAAKSSNFDASTFSELFPVAYHALLFRGLAGFSLHKEVILNYSKNDVLPSGVSQADFQKILNDLLEESEACYEMASQIIHQQIKLLSSSNSAQQLQSTQQQQNQSFQAFSELVSFKINKNASSFESSKQSSSSGTSAGVSTGARISASISVSAKASSSTSAVAASSSSSSTTQASSSSTPSQQSTFNLPLVDELEFCVPTESINHLLQSSQSSAASQFSSYRYRVFLHVGLNLKLASSYLSLLNSTLASKSTAASKQSPTANPQVDRIAKICSLLMRISASFEESQLLAISYTILSSLQLVIQSQHTVLHSSGELPPAIASALHESKCRQSRIAEKMIRSNVEGQLNQLNSSSIHQIQSTLDPVYLKQYCIEVMKACKDNTQTKTTASSTSSTTQSKPAPAKSTAASKATSSSEPSAPALSWNQLISFNHEDLPIGHSFYASIHEKLSTCFRLLSEDIETSIKSEATAHIEKGKYEQWKKQTITFIESKSSDKSKDESYSTDDMLSALVSLSSYLKMSSKKAVQQEIKQDKSSVRPAFNQLNTYFFERQYLQSLLWSSYYSEQISFDDLKVIAASCLSLINETGSINIAKSSFPSVQSFNRRGLASQLTSQQYVSLASNSHPSLQYQPYMNCVVSSGALQNVMSTTACSSEGHIFLQGFNVNEYMTRMPWQILIRLAMRGMAYQHPINQLKLLSGSKPSSNPPFFIEQLNELCMITSEELNEYVDDYSSHESHEAPTFKSFIFCDSKLSLIASNFFFRFPSDPLSYLSFIQLNINNWIHDNDKRHTTRLKIDTMTRYLTNAFQFIKSKLDSTSSSSNDSQASYSTTKPYLKMILIDLADLLIACHYLMTQIHFIDMLFKSCIESCLAGLNILKIIQEFYPTQFSCYPWYSIRFRLTLARAMMRVSGTSKSNAWIHSEFKNPEVCLLSILQNYDDTHPEALSLLADLYFGQYRLVESLNLYQKLAKLYSSSQLKQHLWSSLRIAWIRAQPYLLHQQIQENLACIQQFHESVALKKASEASGRKLNQEEERLGRCWMWQGSYINDVNWENAVIELKKELLEQTKNAKAAADVPNAAEPSVLLSASEISQFMSIAIQSRDRLNEIIEDGHKDFSWSLYWRGRIEWALGDKIQAKQSWMLSSKAASKAGADSSSQPSHPLALSFLGHYYASQYVHFGTKNDYEASKECFAVSMAKFGAFRNSTKWLDGEVRQAIASSSLLEDVGSAKSEASPLGSSSAHSMILLESARPLVHILIESSFNPQLSPSLSDNEEAMIEEAESSYERAMALLESMSLNGFSWAALKAANCQMRKNQFIQAITSLQSFLRRHPDHFDGWVCLSEAYKRQGKYAAALKVCEKLRSIAPESPLAQYISSSISRKSHLLSQSIEFARNCTKMIEAHRRNKSSHSDAFIVNHIPPFLHSAVTYNLSRSLVEAYYIKMREGRFDEAYLSLTEALLYATYLAKSISSNQSSSQVSALSLESDHTILLDEENIAFSHAMIFKLIADIYSIHFNQRWHIPSYYLDYEKTMDSTKGKDAQGKAKMQACPTFDWLDSVCLKPVRTDSSTNNKSLAHKNVFLHFSEISNLDAMLDLRFDEIDQKLSEACKSLNKCIQLQPDNHSLYSDLALLFFNHSILKQEQLDRLQQKLRKVDSKKIDDELVSSMLQLSQSILNLIDESIHNIKLCLSLTSDQNQDVEEGETESDANLMRKRNENVRYWRLLAQLSQHFMASIDNLKSNPAGIVHIPQNIAERAVKTDSSSAALNSFSDWFKYIESSLRHVPNDNLVSKHFLRSIDYTMNSPLTAQEGASENVSSQESSRSWSAFASYIMTKALSTIYKKIGDVKSSSVPDESIVRVILESCEKSRELDSMNPESWAILSIVKLMNWEQPLLNSSQTSVNPISPQLASCLSHMSLENLFGGLLAACEDTQKSSGSSSASSGTSASVSSSMNRQGWMGLGSFLDPTAITVLSILALMSTSKNHQFFKSTSTSSQVADSISTEEIVSKVAPIMSPMIDLKDVSERSRVLDEYGFVRRALVLLELQNSLQNPLQTSSNSTSVHILSLLSDRLGFKNNETALRHAKTISDSINEIKNRKDSNKSALSIHLPFSQAHIDQSMLLNASSIFKAAGNESEAEKSMKLLQNLASQNTHPVSNILSAIANFKMASNVSEKCQQAEKLNAEFVNLIFAKNPNKSFTWIPAWTIDSILNSILKKAEQDDNMMVGAADGSKQASKDDFGSIFSFQNYVRSISLKYLSIPTGKTAKTMSGSASLTESLSIVVLASINSMLCNVVNDLFKSSKSFEVNVVSSSVKLLNRVIENLSNIVELIPDDGSDARTITFDVFGCVLENAFKIACSSFYIYSHIHKHALESSDTSLEKILVSQSSELAKLSQKMFLLIESKTRSIRSKFLESIIKLSKSTIDIILTDLNQVMIDGQSSSDRISNLISQFSSSISLLKSSLHLHASTPITSSSDVSDNNENIEELERSREVEFDLKILKTLRTSNISPKSILVLSSALKLYSLIRYRSILTSRITTEWNEQEESVVKRGVDFVDLESIQSLMSSNNLIAHGSIESFVLDYEGSIQSALDDIEAKKKLKQLEEETKQWIDQNMPSSKEEPASQPFPKAEPLSSTPASSSPSSQSLASSSSSIQDNQLSIELLITNPIDNQQLLDPSANQNNEQSNMTNDPLDALNRHVEKSFLISQRNVMISPWNCSHWQNVSDHYSYRSNCSTSSISTSEDQSSSKKTIETTIRLAEIIEKVELSNKTSLSTLNLACQSRALLSLKMQFKDDALYSKQQLKYIDDKMKAIKSKEANQLEICFKKLQNIKSPNQASNEFITFESITEDLNMILSQARITFLSSSSVKTLIASFSPVLKILAALIDKFIVLESMSIINYNHLVKYLSIYIRTHCEMAYLASNLQNFAVCDALLKNAIEFVERVSVNQLSSLYTSMEFLDAFNTACMIHAYLCCRQGQYKTALKSIEKCKISSSSSPSQTLVSNILQCIIYKNLGRKSKHREAVEKSTEQISIEAIKNWISTKSFAISPEE